MAGANVAFVVGAHLRNQLLRIGVPEDKIIATARLATLGTEWGHLPGELRLATVARWIQQGHFHTLAAIARTEGWFEHQLYDRRWRLL